MGTLARTRATGSAESAPNNKTQAKRSPGKSKPPAAQTVSGKYIFLDVVGFTHGRSVEAQSEIVGVLNSVVHAAIRRVDRKHVILLPTGDGICICLINVDTPYDVHLRVSLDILERISKHNAGAGTMRQFQARGLAHLYVRQRS
jgi:hypothetical protein